MYDYQKLSFSKIRMKINSVFSRFLSTHTAYIDVWPSVRSIMSDVLAQLAEIRNNTGNKKTVGLKDEIITRFSSKDQNLIRAISEASEVHKQHLDEFGEEYMMMDESDLITHLQSDYVNFYAPATVNPYVAIAARGPWIVTSHGAVLHDNGGYGMLGGGHGPDDVIGAMSKNWVMANVMTASFSQKRLAEALRKEV